MNQYETYKESGVEWLRNVPTHWDVKQIKRLSEVKRGASPRPIDDPKYFDDEGEYAWVRISDVTASDRYLENTRQRLSKLGKDLSVPMQPGDFFLSIAGSVGKPIITKIKCCIHDGFVYFPRFKQNKEFLFYVFASGQPYLGLGKLGTQLNLNTDTVGSIYIGLPSKGEQEQIVGYLDKETARIDKLIANKRQQIKKLDELRQITISHAVTRGLDPTVPMKDSGIVWLGKIPASWRVIKIRHLAKVGNGSTPNRSEARYWAGGSIPWLNSSSVNKGFITESDQFVTDTAATECHLPLVKSGSVLIAITGQGKTRGTAALLKFEATINQHMSYITPQSGNLDSMYLYQLLVGLYTTLRLISEGAGSTKGALTCDDVKNFKIPVPDIDEQRNIAKYVENEMFLLDRLTNNIEQQIERLAELRKITINDAVTGKVKVTD